MHCFAEPLSQLGPGQGYLSCPQMSTAMSLAMPWTTLPRSATQSAHAKILPSCALQGPSAVQAHCGQKELPWGDALLSWACCPSVSSVLRAHLSQEPAW